MKEMRQKRLLSQTDHHWSYLKICVMKGKNILTNYACIMIFFYNLLSFVISIVMYVGHKDLRFIT